MASRILRGQVVRFRDVPAIDEVDAALVFDSDGGVVIRDGRVVEVGPASSVCARHPDAQVTHRPDALHAPGFVDAHVHYPQTGIIGSYGAKLLDWLEMYTFPEEERLSDPAWAAQVARRYFDETLRHGTTTGCSFGTVHPCSVDAYFEEAARRGVRAVGGKVWMDRNAPLALRDTAQSASDASIAAIARWHGKNRATYAITPRFAPTSSPEQLEAAGDLWKAHPDCVVQSHLSENIDELAWVRDLFPGARDYLDVYDRAGLVGARAVFGHGVHLSERELSRLAEAGAAVAHCPTSNLFLGSGLCDVGGLASSGVTVGLGTDVGAGASFSMLQTMRAAYMVGQLRGTSLSPAALWWLATVGGARCLGLERSVGNIASGLDADVVVLDPGATPLLADRTARAESVEELLFAIIILGDDRSVIETWSGGEVVHR